LGSHHANLARRLSHPALIFINLPTKSRVDANNSAHRCFETDRTKQTERNKQNETDSPASIPSSLITYLTEIQTVFLFLLLRQINLLLAATFCHIVIEVGRHKTEIMSSLACQQQMTINLSLFDQIGELSPPGDGLHRQLAFAKFTIDGSAATP
jgi:hypothetical protein